MGLLLLLLLFACLPLLLLVVVLLEPPPPTSGNLGGLSGIVKTLFPEEKKGSFICFLLGDLLGTEEGDGDAWWVLEAYRDSKKACLLLRSSAVDVMREILTGGVTGITWE